MIESFGKYRVIERIGEGGFGQVYRGRDSQLSRDVAIKAVSLAAPEARERFPREAAIAAGLRHPAIVTIYDFGEQDGVPYLVQEYLPGEDLASRIARRNAGDLATRVRWLTQVADGLHYAHGRGIIHRDIKPGNVRVLEDGTVRIMDFGIAKAVHATTQLTGTNVSLGTSGYVAPEQLDGRPIDGRADMFAFGVMAYELITYVRPFEAETVSATLYRILTADPVPVLQLAPETPTRLAACIERCLRKRREERFADMAEVEVELAGVLQDLEAEASPGLAIGASVIEPSPVTGATVALPSAAPSTPAAPTAEPAHESRPATRTPVSEPAGGTGRQKAVVMMAALLILALTGWAAVAAINAIGGGAGTRNAIPLDVAGADDEAPAGGPDSPIGSASGAEPGGTPADSAGMVPANADVAAGSGARGVGAADAQPAERTGGVQSGSPTGGSTETAPARSAQASQPAAVSSSDPVSSVQIDPGKVLVLISGDRPDAAGSAQNIVLSRLLAAGRRVVDPDAVDAIRADAAAVEALHVGASPAAGVGRAYGAGTVVVADLTTDAAPAPGGFVTGTAVLTAKFYDSSTGDLLLAETYRVGSGGTPGRPGATEAAAVTQAAESVARQLASAILTRTGG